MDLQIETKILFSRMVKEVSAGQLGLVIKSSSSNKEAGGSKPEVAV